MNITKTKLKNGLNVIIIEVPDLEIVSTNLTVGAGGHYEEPHLFGISHFLEHMAFKGTRKFPEKMAFTDAIEGIGGEQNAWTSEEYTTYFNKVPVAHAGLAFSSLSEQVSHLLLREEDINDERGVIIEEINRSNDNPQSLIWHKLSAVLWPGQNAASDVLGPRENIQRFVSSDFKKYMSKYYVIDNMNICIAGGLGKERAIELLEANLSELRIGAKEIPGPIIVNQTVPVTRLFNKKVDQSQVVLAYKTFARNHNDEPALRVLVTLLGGGMTSILFREIREKRGLAYTVAADLELYSNAGVAFVYAGLNKEKTEEAISVIKEELEKIKSGIFEDGEFKRAKEFAKGKYLLKFDGTETISSWFGVQALVNPEGKEVSERVAALEAVTREDIVRVAKEVFRSEVENLVIVGPFSDEEKFARILTQGGIYV